MRIRKGSDAAASCGEKGADGKGAGARRVGGSFSGVASQQQRTAAASQQLPPVSSTTAHKVVVGPATTCATIPAGTASWSSIRRVRRSFMRLDRQGHHMEAMGKSKYAYVRALPEGTSVQQNRWPRFFSEKSALFRFQFPCQCAVGLPWDHLQI